MTEDIPVDKRKLARELLLKAKFYRACAMLFLFVGLTIFAVLYSTRVDGNILNALRKPLIVISLVVPFLPAAVLAKLSDKAHRRLVALLEVPAPAAKTASAEKPAPGKEKPKA